MNDFLQQWYSKYVFISAGLLLASLLFWLYWLSSSGVTYELLRQWYVPFIVFACNAGGVVVGAISLDKKEQSNKHKIWIFSLIGVHLILILMYPVLHYLVAV